MKIIGITGPTGAGKSLLSEYLSHKGIPVIDADEVYHSLLIPPSDCLDAIRRAFGDRVLAADGSLDRPALSEIVFHDREKLALLNETVLHFVLDRVRVQLNEWEARGVPFAAIDAPTLIESGFHAECDTVISVLSDTELRVCRIMERDGITKERAVARVAAQQADDFYRAHSDYILENRENRDAFFAKADALWLTLTEK